MSDYQRQQSLLKKGIKHDDINIIQSLLSDKEFQVGIKSIKLAIKSKSFTVLPLLVERLDDEERDEVLTFLLQNNPSIIEMLDFPYNQIMIKALTFEDGYIKFRPLFERLSEIDKEQYEEAFLSILNDGRTDYRDIHTLILYLPDDFVIDYTGSNPNFKKDVEMFNRDQQMFKKMVRRSLFSEKFDDIPSFREAYDKRDIKYLRDSLIFNQDDFKEYKDELYKAINEKDLGEIELLLSLDPLDMGQKVYLNDYFNNMSKITMDNVNDLPFFTFLVDNISEGSMTRVEIIMELIKSNSHFITLVLDKKLLDNQAIVNLFAQKSLVNLEAFKIFVRHGADLSSLYLEDDIEMKWEVFEYLFKKVFLLAWQVDLEDTGCQYYLVNNGMTLNLITLLAKLGARDIIIQQYLDLANILDDEDNKCQIYDIIRAYTKLTERNMEECHFVEESYESITDRLSIDHLQLRMISDQLDFIGPDYYLAFESLFSRINLPLLQHMFPYQLQRLFIRAVKKGNNDIVLLFLKNGYSLKDDEESFVYITNLPLLKLFVEDYKVNIFANSSFSLSEFARNRYNDMLEYLLLYKEKDGKFFLQTPLLEAINFSNYDGAEIIIRHGGEIDKSMFNQISIPKTTEGYKFLVNNIKVDDYGDYFYKLFWQALKRFLIQAARLIVEKGFLTVGDYEKIAVNAVREDKVYPLKFLYGEGLIKPGHELLFLAIDYTSNNVAKYLIDLLRGSLEFDHLFELLNVNGKENILLYLLRYYSPKIIKIDNPPVNNIIVEYNNDPEMYVQRLFREARTGSYSDNS